MSDQFYEKLSLDSLHALLHRTKVLADKAVRPYRSAIRFDVPRSAILDKRSIQQPGVLPLAPFQRGCTSELRYTNPPVAFFVIGWWVAVLVADPNDPGMRSSQVYPARSIKNASDTTTD